MFSHKSIDQFTLRCDRCIVDPALVSDLWNLNQVVISSDDCCVPEEAVFAVPLAAPPSPRIRTIIFISIFAFERDQTNKSHLIHAAIWFSSLLHYMI